MNTILTNFLAFTPPGPSTPPGLELLNTIVSWVMWAAAAYLFVLFIVGLTKAANARNQGGASDAAAPIWPMVCAIILGAAGTIWAVIS